MELEIAESLPGHDIALADGQEAVGDRPVGGGFPIALDPAAEMGAVEQGNRALGWLPALRRIVGLAWCLRRRTNRGEQDEHDRRVPERSEHGGHLLGAMRLS